MSESLTLTVIPLMGLKLPLLPSPGVKVISNRTETELFHGVEIYLSNNPDTISGLLDRVHPGFLGIPPLQKVQEAAGDHSLLYSFDLKWDLKRDTDAAAMAATQVEAIIYKILRGIEHALWRVKDNNVSLGEMWCLDSAGRMQPWAPLHLNTNCEGLWLGGTEFTEDELAAAVGFLNDPMWHDEMFLGFTRGSETILGGRIFHIENASSENASIRRCLNFLDHARTVGDIGLRIVLYVTCLETLFSTDASELTHKLAERVAWFIGEDGTDRLEVFASVKRVYDVRSKVIHGSVPKGEGEQLILVAKSADNLLRRIVNKIYEQPEYAALFLCGPQTPEEHRQFFEKYFTDLIFDRPPSLT